jgi:hypothetical protein
VGSLDKRIENLERRVGSPQPVVLVLMKDGPPGREREEAVEVGRFTLYSTEGEDRAYLSDPNYNTLKLRLEGAHSAVEAAAVEARRRVRLNERR